MTPGINYLVDSDVLIDALRGLPQARRLLRTKLDKGLTIYGSTMTKAEVLAGARDDELKMTEQLLMAFEWIPVSEEVAEAASTLARRYRRSHSGIDLVDYTIAATTKALNAQLLTRNVKHYPMKENLKAAY